MLKKILTVTFLLILLLGPGCGSQRSAVPGEFLGSNPNNWPNTQAYFCNSCQINAQGIQICTQVACP